METMNTNMVEAVDSESTAFVLSPLKSTDVWQMVRILKRIDLMGAAKSVGGQLAKYMDYKEPTMMQNGEEVALPKERWTKAQKKAHEKAMEARDALLWAILGVLMENIDSCEDDVNRMLATGIGKDLGFIQAMDANTYLELLVQFVTREEFGDFFAHAIKLLQKMNLSQNSIASVATLIR